MVYDVIDIALVNLKYEKAEIKKNEGQTMEYTALNYHADLAIVGRIETSYSNLMFIYTMEITSGLDNNP